MNRELSSPDLETDNQVPGLRLARKSGAPSDKASTLQLPKLVICAGLPRSGSTWIYNVVLMLLRSRTKAVGTFSNTIPGDLAAHSEANGCLVVKCHAPDANLIALARLLGAPVILTVRDPRDCLVSFEAAFQTERAGALHELSESASALLQLESYQRQFLVKYEETSDRVKLLESLGAFLGITVGPKLAKKISEELSLEAVKENIARWEAEGALDAERPAEVWTEESHWHANHIANGLTGKYVDHLSQREAAIVSNRMRSFFQKFGYAPDAPPAIKSGDVIEFGGDGIAYAVEGFSFPENWGAWTDQPTARITLPLTKKIRRVQLEIALKRGCLGHGHGGATGQVRVNKRKVADLFCDPLLPYELVFIYNGGATGDQLELEFMFKGLVSPRSLNLGEDERLLGVGVRSVKISYQ